MRTDVLLFFKSFCNLIQISYCGLARRLTKLDVERSVELGLDNVFHPHSRLGNRGIANIRSC